MTDRAAVRGGAPGRRTAPASPRARRALIDWTLRMGRALGLLRDAPAGAGGPSRSILFVCRANLIRSPMGAALLAGRLLEMGVSGVDVASAGLYAANGRPADPRARGVARSFGVSLDGHRSRLLRAAMVEKADLIVALDSLIEAELRERHPRAGGKIARLLERRNGRAPRPVDIPDPWDGGEEDVRRTCDLLRSCVLEQAAHLCAGRAAREETEARHAP